MPAANAGPRQRARPRYASSTRPLPPACPSDLWCILPTLRPILDGASSGRRRDHIQRRRGWVRERGGAGARREGRLGRAREERGKRTDRSKTNPHPLHKLIPVKQSDGEEATRRQNPQMGKGRRGKSQGIPRPRRTYVSGRSMDTESTPTLAHTLTAELVTIRHGKRGGVTSWSCHRGAMTRRSGRSGDAS